MLTTGPEYITTAHTLNHSIQECTESFQQDKGKKISDAGSVDHTQMFDQPTATIKAF